MCLPQASPTMCRARAALDWRLGHWPSNFFYDAAILTIPYSSSSFFQSVLRWSVAVSTICRHSSRVVAFLQAVARLKFRGPRSASIARSHVWPGLPAGSSQSGGTCRIHAARAWWWSSRGELRAIWPKSRRRTENTKVSK